MRTSHSHPLMIDHFQLAQGKVGMTLLPGRKGQAELGPEWNRELKDDVLRLKLWRGSAGRAREHPRYRSSAAGLTR